MQWVSKVFSVESRTHADLKADISDHAEGDHKPVAIWDADRHEKPLTIMKWIKPGFRQICPIMRVFHITKPRA